VNLSPNDIICVAADRSARIEKTDDQDILDKQTIFDVQLLFAGMAHAMRQPMRSVRDVHSSAQSPIMTALVSLNALT
jgi:hypothetical protein